MKNQLSRRKFCKAGTELLVVAAASRMWAQAINMDADEAKAYLAKERQAGLAVAQIKVSSLGNQKLASWGLVDVTSRPFNADPTGVTDATAAIQLAITFARENKMVLHFPGGSYRISDTLRCVQGNHHPVFMAWRGDRDYACVLMGSKAGTERARLVLAPRSAGYRDASKPKYVVQYWNWSKEQGPPLEEDNANFSQMFVGIDIVIGENNPGAVGIRCRGAQGTSVQDCTIDATHGYSGLEGGAGSGGSHHNVTVLGGRVGADLREVQPAPTISGFTLRGQTEHAILYDGRQTLSAVGCKIEFAGSGPAIVVGGKRPIEPNGQVCMVDSTIEFTNAGDNLAFGGTSSLYLNNVYVKGAHRLADWGAGRTGDLNAKVWTRVVEYAHGRGPLPVTSAGLGPFTFTAPIYVDGKVLTKDPLETSITTPPADLASRHMWDKEFPYWDSPGVVNVKNARNCSAS